MEKEKEDPKGSPALLQRIRTAASARAKLKAALEREAESNQFLCNRIKAAGKRPEAKCKKQVSYTVKGTAGTRSTFKMQLRMLLP